MTKFKGSEGLYKKTESPIVESVKQTEGLYKKTNVASVELENPTQADKDAIAAMESKNEGKPKILKS